MLQERCLFFYKTLLDSHDGTGTHASATHYGKFLTPIRLSLSKTPSRRPTSWPRCYRSAVFFSTRRCWTHMMEQGLTYRLLITVSSSPRSDSRCPRHPLAGP